MSIYEYFQGVITALLVTLEWQNWSFQRSKTHVSRAFCPHLQVFAFRRT